MAICGKCGAHIKDSDNFCIKCGSKREAQPVQVAQYVQPAQPIQQPQPVQPVPVPAADRPAWMNAAVPEPTPVAPVASAVPVAPAPSSTPNPPSPFDSEDSTDTTVLVQITYWLERLSNGERQELQFPCVVGRGSAADYRVLGNPAVSRKHARLELEEGRVFVSDLASTNSVYVDEKPVAANGRMELTDGCVVRLGNEEFRFSVE